MSVRGSLGAPAAWRAREEALLHKERLVHFLERARILTHGGGDGGEPDRSTLELLDDGLQDPAVHVVEPELVHVEPLNASAATGPVILPPARTCSESRNPFKSRFATPRRAAPRGAVLAVAGAAGGP